MAPSDTLKNSFVAGAALIAPLVITLVALRLIFGWLSAVIDPIVSGASLGRLTGNVPYVAELLALGIIFLAVAVMGYLAQKTIGALFFQGLDRTLGLVPLVSVIYSSVRQVSNALTRRQTRYESVAMIEYPREGLYTLGFVTADSPQTATSAIGKDAVNVYLPGSPNPTQGRLLLVPDDQVTELEMSVSRGIRLLVTTGMAENEQELEALHDETTRAVEEETPELAEAFEE
ncbi:DUF502 domain-containing protein [Halobacteriales archaeon Cl-PHB]